MKIISLPVLAVAAVLFCGGCATYTPPERVSVALAGIQSAESSILETTLVLTLRITNETNVPLHLTGTSHKLTLNGSVVGRGVNNSGLDVPALGSLTLPLTFHVNNLELFRQFGKGRIPEEISYLIDTRLFTAPSERDLAVLTEGKLDLRPYEHSLLLN